jgi:hypothetical protein
LINNILIFYRGFLYFLWKFLWLSRNHWFDYLNRLLNQRSFDIMRLYCQILILIRSDLCRNHFNIRSFNFFNWGNFWMLFYSLLSFSFLLNFRSRNLWELFLSDFPLFLIQHSFSSYLSACLTNSITWLALSIRLSYLICSICCLLFLFILFSFCH